MSSVVPPGSADEALEMLMAAMSYLAASDATQMAAGEQARCLRVFEQVTAVGTAARTSVLSTFTAGQGYSADADYSPRAWLIHKTGVTKAAAVAYTAWARRAAEHPRVLAALAAGELSESYGRTICTWTGELPEDCREAADAILLSAARAGLDLRELAGLFAEMYERSRSDLPDEDPAQAFGDRGVRLDTTFQGAGVLNGDLTPECAAVVGAVLDALSAPAGAEDDRTREQRYHDALQEAIARLVAADEDTVRDVIHAFNAKGLAALAHRWAGGRPRRISDGDIEVIVAAARTRPEKLGQPFTRCCLRKLAGCLAGLDRPVRIGRERLRQIPQARGISFQRTRTWKESTDPDRDAKLDRIEYVTGHYPDRRFGFDQFGPLSIRPCHGACWAPRKRPARLRATYHRADGIRYFHGCYCVGNDQLWELSASIRAPITRWPR
jgi:transposase